MKNYKLVLLAICALWGNSVVQGQGSPVSAVPLRAESGMSKIVQDQGEGKVLYGYCPSDFNVTSKTGVGFNTDDKLKVNAAIRLSEGITNILKGRKIHRLRIGVASNAEATIFLRNAAGTNLNEVKQALNLGWNEILLETPWEIPGEKELYIGYSCTQYPKEFVIAMANTTSKTNGCFLSTEDMTLTEYSGLGNLCIMAEVDGMESEFGYVGSIASVYASNPYLQRGAGQTSEIALNFLNEGETNVSTIKLGRSFNGTELGDTVCGFKRTLRANSIGELTLKVTPPETGKYTFTLKEMGEKPVAASARAAAFSYYNSEDAVPRTILMEEFTSQSCGNCPSGQKALHDLVAGNEDRVAMVLHHSGYYPDDFSIEESDAYCYFYNSANTYAPAMTMDRSYYAEYDKEGIGSLAFDPRYLTNSRFQKELELPAMVSVGIESAYDEATRKLTVKVSGYKITDLIGDHIGTTVFLLESNYVARQSQGGENFEHNNFPRYVLSAADGDVITFEGNRYSKEYTYTIPETFVSTTKTETQAHPENMHIVAFVSNFDHTHPDNCVVLNACKTASLNDVVTSVETVDSPAWPLRVFAQDGKVIVAGGYEVLGVYDLQGMPVRNEGLQPGMYIVKVTSADGKEQVSKVILK